MVQKLDFFTAGWKKLMGAQSAENSGTLHYKRVRMEEFLLKLCDVPLRLRTDILSRSSIQSKGHLLEISQIPDFSEHRCYKRRVAMLQSTYYTSELQLHFNYTGPRSIWRPYLVSAENSLAKKNRTSARYSTVGRRSSTWIRRNMV